MWYNVYMKYKTDKQVVFACRYHVVWCVKYRRRILTDAVCDRLKELITRECREMGIELSDIRISDDHVYLQLDMTLICLGGGILTMGIMLLLLFAGVKETKGVNLEQV